MSKKALHLLTDSRAKFTETNRTMKAIQIVPTVTFGRNSCTNDNAVVTNKFVSIAQLLANSNARLKLVLILL